MKNYDLVIIGAGSAGLSVASGAAQLGLNVALAEKAEMGGDCLNVGCVPSKALLSAAKAVHHSKTSMAKFGLASAPVPQIDYAQVMAHVQDSIAAIAPHDSQERFEGLGVDVYREPGVIESANSVRLGDQVVGAKIIVIATGSRPFVPPIPGLDSVDYLTNETLFANRQKPEHLIVVGGGPIGVEMAQAHVRLGCKVTLVEMASLMPHDDPEAVEVVRQTLIHEGIDVREGTALMSVAPGEGGTGVRATLSIDGTEEMIEGSHLLMAAGRKANVEGLNLDAVGVETHRGGIQVDKQLRTNVKNIYAIGDVAGGPQFTHWAGMHASSFVRNVLFRMSVDVNKSWVPWVTYADPELAQFGLTEAAAKKSGEWVATHKVELAALDRNVTEADKVGFAKIILGAKNKLLGVTMVGHNAGELITPWLVAQAGDVPLSKIAGMVVPYPTRGEVTKRLASLAFVDRLFSDRTRRIVRTLFRLPRF